MNIKLAAGAITSDASTPPPALSRPRAAARQAYVYGIRLLFAAIVVQFFLAGLGSR